MFRKRFVVIVAGVFLALAAATSASAQGRHAVGSAVKTVVHVVGISSDEGDQGNTDDGNVQDGNVDQGNVQDSNVDQGNVQDGNTDDGEKDNVDNGNVQDGNTDGGDQGNQGNANQGNQGN